MAVGDLSYKELIGINCFIIPALLTIGKNLKRSLINLISNLVPLEKQTPLKKTNLYGSTNKMKW